MGETWLATGASGEMEVFIFFSLLFSSLTVTISSAQCLGGMTVEKTHTWEKGFIGKLILDQSWLSKPTEDWLLGLGFCSQVEEFKIWSATIVSPASQGNFVKNVEAVNITNVCWNGILYSCQSYEISFLVRFPTTSSSSTAAYDLETVTEHVPLSDGTATSSTTTTTTTATFYSNVGLKIYARDSVNNDPVRQALANVSFIQDNSQLVPVATSIELNSKGFYTIQPIPSGGNYQVCIYKEGFEDKNTTIFVDATMDNEIVSKFIIMNPDIAPGETNIQMTWETDPPTDMDLFVATIRNSDDDICVISFSNPNCEAASKIRDNAAGGTNGPETILLTDPSVNSQFTYVLGVNDFDFGNSGEDLEMSMAFITVINNVQSFEFPKLSVDTFNMTHHYYFFGCITVDTSGEFSTSQAPTGVIFNGDDTSEWLQLRDDYC